MLSKRDNLLECIRGGNPDRYVNQFEPFVPMAIGTPLTDRSLDDEGNMTDEWGVVWKVAGQPGRMPLHDMKHRVVTDITEWREQVKVPTGYDNAVLWEPLQEKLEANDYNDIFRTVGTFPGIFERLHDLCEITETLMNLYEEPESVQELLKVITEVELEQAEAICKYLKPEVLFHHDDWGTQASTFMSTDMFEEFLLEPYKQVYGYYKDHGVDLIIHHSDTYGMTLVPHMIEMGVDIWQGALFETNDIQQLVDTYGGKFTVMGGIEDAEVDTADWTQEKIDAHVDRVLDTIDRKCGFIPCLTHGLNASIYPGCYDAITKSIDRRSKLDFA